MKKIYNLFLLAAVIMLSFTGCSSDESFITAGPEDTPRFLAPSSIEGNAETSMNQNRDEVFSMEVVVTPAKYVTIEWISEGRVLGSGTSFSKQFEAGEYELLIKATTQAGKVATRIVKLSVKALAEDPQIDNNEKNRWLNPGNVLTIEGTNLAGVKALVFTPFVEEGDTRADESDNTPPIGDGSIEIPCEAAADGKSVTVTLPAEMAKGSYRVSAVKENEERFGCGLVTVTDEEWVDPDVEKKLLWEGSQVINWGDANVRISADELADVKEGTTIYIKYSVPEAEYHAMRITAEWWDYDIVPQFDLTDNTPNPYSFEYTAEVMEKVQTEGAMLIVGFGYEVQEVYYEALSPNAETVLWEADPVDINWGDSNIHLTVEQLESVQPGATIRVYYEMIDAEYHAMRVTSNWWEYDFVSQFDITAETPNPFEFEFTSEHQQKAQEQEGMLVVGFGYRVSKIAYK